MPNTKTLAGYCRLKTWLEPTAETSVYHITSDSGHTILLRYSDGRADEPTVRTAVNVINLGIIKLLPMMEYSTCGSRAVRGPADFPM